MALTCPSCGNERNFLVKTLQIHVVQVEDSHVEVSEESRPGVLEVLCDECETALDFAGVRRLAPEGSAVDAGRPLISPTSFNLLRPRRRSPRSSRSQDRSTLVLRHGSSGRCRESAQQFPVCGAASDSRTWGIPWSSLLLPGSGRVTAARLSSTRFAR